MQSIKLDGASFNKAWIGSFSSEAAFLKEMEKPDYKHLYEGANREAKLKAVYALVHPKTEAPAERANASKTLTSKQKTVGTPEAQSLAGGSDEG